MSGWTWGAKTRELILTKKYQVTRHLLKNKVYSPVICLCFGVWVTLGRRTGWQSHTCVKNLGVEVCSKFGGDWSRGSCVIEGNRHIDRKAQIV